jgi:hypothetical protein
MAGLGQLGRDRTQSSLARIIEVRSGFLALATFPAGTFSAAL